MISFPAYACGFELYPTQGEAFRHLSPLLSRLSRIEFNFSVADPSTNQGQLTSNFDTAFKEGIVELGASIFQLQLPAQIRQQLDFAFSINGHRVAVEVEKTNREKILRDILKSHIYLHFGADFSLVILPKNYPHKHGIWDLYHFGIQQLQDCITYGFGVGDTLERILLMGFESCSTRTNEAHSVRTRQAMRTEAQLGGNRPVGGPAYRRAIHRIINVEASATAGSLHWDKVFS